MLLNWFKAPKSGQLHAAWAKNIYFESLVPPHLICDATLWRLQTDASVRTTQCNCSNIPWSTWEDAAALITAQLGCSRWTSYVHILSKRPTTRLLKPRKSYKNVPRIRRFYHCSVRLWWLSTLKMCMHTFNTTPGYLWNLRIMKTPLLFNVYNWKHGPSFSRSVIFVPCNLVCHFQIRHFPAGRPFLALPCTTTAMLTQEKRHRN